MEPQYLATKQTRVATTTAGLRGTQWDPDRLPSGVSLTVHPLRTRDGASVTGYLFRRGGERTVVCSMHPRELTVASYLVPEVLLGGCAMWILGSRSPGNDLRLEHESALLDLAAGQHFLRDVAKFENCVLQGTSGGGPLATFYYQQASLAPAARIKTTPAGRPSKLDTATLPLPDGVVLVSTHPGQGKLLLNNIDPAVINEMDPLQSDERLSAFNPDNGFCEPPQSSNYSAEFLATYRAAQRSRVERIDAFAFELMARKAEARARLKTRWSSGDAIIAAHSPIFQVWRTDADPRCFDLNLDPSDRAYGTLWGANPLVSNYGSIGFARVCTPESWLSNWSGLSSNASMLACAPDLVAPTLMIEYTGDNSVFPCDGEAIYSAIGSCEKTRHRIHGNHHGKAIDPLQPNGQTIAGQYIRDWLQERRFT